MPGRFRPGIRFFGLWYLLLGLVLLGSTSDIVRSDLMTGWFVTHPAIRGSSMPRRCMRTRKGWAVLVEVKRRATKRFPVWNIHHRYNMYNWYWLILVHKTFDTFNYFFTLMGWWWWWWSPIFHGHWSNSSDICLVVSAPATVLTPLVALFFLTNRQWIIHKLPFVRRCRKDTTCKHFFTVGCMLRIHSFCSPTFFPVLRQSCSDVNIETWSFKNNCRVWRTLQPIQV